MSGVRYVHVKLPSTGRVVQCEIIEELPHNCVVVSFFGMEPFTAERLSLEDIERIERESGR